MADRQVHEFLELGKPRRARTQFLKGVAVFESVEPVVSPTSRQIGTAFVAEKDIKRCRTCQRPGHVQKDCPEKLLDIVCRKCKQKGHYQTQCTTNICNHCKQQGHSNDACPTVVCSNCEQIGHGRKACRAGRTCANCRSPDHDMGVCPQPCRNCKGMHPFDECSNPKPVHLNTTPDKETVHPNTTPDDDTHMSEAGAGEVDIDEAKDEEQERFLLPDGQECEVKLTMEHLSEHASSLNFQFLVSFWGAPGQRDLAHKTLILRLMHQNIDGPITVETINLDDAKVANHLNSDTRAKIRQVLQDSPALNLRRISVAFVPGKNGQDRAKGILGQAFFAPFELGEFTQLFTTLRDQLRATERSVLHFYVVDNGWWTGDLEQLDADIRDQGLDNPLRKWHNGGKINIQNGMQISKAAIAERQYQLDIRDRFDSAYEWFTVQFYSAMERLEASEENDTVETRLRVIRFPGGDDRVYACALEATENVSLRTDAVISVRFLGEDADADKDWQGVVSPPVPFLPLTDHLVFLRRPREGDDFLQQPPFEEEHVIDVTAYPTAASLAAAVVQQKGIQVWVTERKPRVHTRRELVCLNRLFLSQREYQWELKLFLGNDFTDIPSLDYFAVDVAKYGLEVVQTELDAAVHDRKLDETQAAAIRQLSQMTGNIWLFNGVGGTGKTEIAVTLILYQVKVNAHASQDTACNIVVVTPINAQADSLAVRLDQALFSEYERKLALHEEDPNAFRKPKYPVVCRVHAKATEIYVYKDSAKQKREETTGRRAPPYIQEPPAVDTEGSSTAVLEDVFTLEDLPEMVMDVMILRTYLHGASNNFDKRLQQRQLSLGQWILRRAGYPDAANETHPIADAELHHEFCERLDSYARGDRTSREDTEALTHSANAVARDVLANVADVSLMTHDTYMQTRVHACVLPRAVFHDEAGKTCETSDISGWVHSRQLVDTKLSPWVPQLLFGDLLQPKPIPIGGLTGPFAAQGSVSLFRRMIEDGVGTSWFWVQHRYAKDICDTINALLPGPSRLETPPSEPSDTRRRVEEFNRAYFNILGGVVFLAVKSEDRTTPVTRSTYNEEHVKRILWLVLEQVSAGIPPEKISIGVPYQAQLRFMIAGRYDLVEYCQKQTIDQDLQAKARTLLNMRITTIDALQGDEADIFVVDTTVTKDLKFMADQARILLALSRAKVGLYIIGNPEGVEANARSDKGSFRRYHNTAYARLVKYCKNNGLFFNLSSTSSAHRAANTAPFDLSHISQRVVVTHAEDKQPITFSLDSDFMPPVSRFRRLEEQDTPNYPLLFRKGRDEVATHNGYTLSDPQGYLLRAAEFETQIRDIIAKGEEGFGNKDEEAVSAGKVVELLNRLNADTPQLTDFNNNKPFRPLPDDDLANQPGYDSFVTLLGYLLELGEVDQYENLVDDDEWYAKETAEQQATIQTIVEDLDIPSNIICRLQQYYNGDLGQTKEKLKLLIVAREFPDVTSATPLIEALEMSDWNVSTVIDMYSAVDNTIERNAKDDEDKDTGGFNEGETWSSAPGDDGGEQSWNQEAGNQGNTPW